MLDLAGAHIRDQKLRLVEQDGIRAHCELVDCAIQIADPRDVYLYDSTFRNTSIQVMKTCKESWRGCCFDTCRFIGKFCDCQFGADSLDGNCKGILRHCDFSETSLHLCSFYNCAPTDLRLPGWPYVTILEPAKNAVDFADIATDPFLDFIRGSMGNSSPKEIATTYDLPIHLKQLRPGIMRRWKIDVLFAKSRSEPLPPEPTLSLEKIRKLLATKPYVSM